MKVTQLKKKVHLPFSYTGSKASMINNLLTILPASIDWHNKRTGIIEPFCGSGIFTFNMMYHFENIFAILNDQDDLLIKIFFEIQNNCDQLINALDKTNISSETLFKKNLVVQDDINETDLNRVVAYLYCQFYCIPLRETLFQSTYRGSLNDVRGFAETNNWPSKIKNVEQYLKRSIINCRTFEASCKINKHHIEQENNNILLFLDPPYLNTKPGSKNKEYCAFNEIDMQKVLQYIEQTAKIPFIFCHFPHPLIEDWAFRNNYYINEFEKNSNMSMLSTNGKLKEKKKEWFITNYNTFYAN